MYYATVILPALCDGPVVGDPAMDLRRASLDANAHSSEVCATSGSRFSDCMCPVASLLRPKTWVCSGSGASQGTTSQAPSRTLALSSIAALVWLTGWSVPAVSARLDFLFGWASATTLSMYVRDTACAESEQGVDFLSFVFVCRILRSSLSTRRWSVLGFMPFFRAQVVM
jgi:hypothetical protein